MTADLLTPSEHDAMDLTAELVRLLAQLVGNGPSRQGDMRELIAAVHSIQHAILSQAAARAYPDRYRLLGGEPPMPVDHPPLDEQMCEAASKAVED